MDGIHHLRVLIANQQTRRLEMLAKVVSELGHEVIAREIHVSEVAAVTARERPDVAFVGLGESAEHALDLITEIVGGAFCPVIALLDAYDGDWVNEAASRGVFAYIVDSRPEELQSAIDITLRRFTEFRACRGRSIVATPRRFARRNARSRSSGRCSSSTTASSSHSRSPTSRSSSTGRKSHGTPCSKPSRTPAPSSAGHSTSSDGKECLSTT